MCLNRVCSITELENWMETQSDTIIVYKIVRYENRKYYPVFVRSWNEFYRINRSDYKYSIPAIDQKSYPPYFHFFCEKKDAENYKKDFFLAHRRNLCRDIL